MGRHLIRQITVCCAIGIVVTFLTVTLTTVWMARSHDQQAAQSTRTMVVGGLETARGRLEAITNDYSWWDEAYQAYVRGDREWLDANIGAGITDTEIADALVIMSPEGKADYSWTIGSTDAETIVTPEVRKQIQIATDGVAIGNLAARSIIAQSPGGILMVGAARITPVSLVPQGLDPKTLPILVMAQYLDGERLSELGSAFLLRDLHLSSKPQREDNSLALKDVGDQSVGYLTWTPPTPGHQILLSAFLPLAAALGIFCTAMLGVSFRARTLAMALSRSEQKAQAGARLDPLTTLMNRNGFNELIASSLCRNAASTNSLSVIYLDVNGFKKVNDTIGHHGGDDLVRQLAGRFREALPPEAHLARVGGDEFAVLLWGPTSAKVAEAAAAIGTALDRPFVISGMEFHVTCAIGYSVANRDTHDPELLIRQADMAMYAAKARGHGEALPFRPSMETGSLEKQQFENRLRKALHDGELAIAYQPIARTADFSVIGLEALIRWHSPVLGHVSPAKLIAVAEESGLIREIGDFVLDRVCSDLHRWPDLRISVNVSPVQLRDPDFTSNFKAMLHRHRVRPSSIELELTEGVLIADPISAAKKLTQLRRLGVTVALDDFGSGFSSIGYLRSFPFDRVKIDRSFIEDLVKNPRGATLLESLVSLADAMDLPVVAEGVETTEQARMLAACKCEFMQGYLLHRPAAPDIIENYLRECASKVVEAVPVLAKKAS